MTCFTYNGVNYTFNEFANLLLSGELENLALEKRISSPITNIGRAISEDIKQVTDKFNRKHTIEKSKYIAALNSSDDLIKIKNFYKKDPIKNTKLSEAQVKKQAKLSEGVDVVELKKRLASINQAWKQTELLLNQAKQAEITIASQKPLVAKNKFELKSILRNLFNLKKVFKTKDNKTVSQDEAAATLMDAVLNTIAQRRSQTEGVPVTAQDIYNNTFYKRSTQQEIVNSLNQLIGKEGIKNLNIPDTETFIDIAGNKRYDLSDLDARFNFETYSEAQTRDVINQLNQGMPLKKLLFHERLFQAYPQLANITVQMKAYEDNRNRGGYLGGSFIFNPNKATILLNNKQANGEPITNLSESFSTLLHEVQHAIQHFEKIDSGTSEREYKQIIDDAMKSAKLLIDKAEEAQDKNITLEEVLTDEDKVVLEDSLVGFTTFDAIPDDEFIDSMEKHVEDLSRINNRDLRKMYQNSLGELEAIVVESRLLLDEEMSKVITFKDMMQSHASVLDATAPIYKDYYDAIFAVLEKKQSPVLFQQSRAAYQESGSFSIGSGRFDILKEGQDIIHAITDPNVSSPLHEVAHKFEKYLTPEERAVVLSFAETPEWTTATSEKFARGFEKYLAEGKAPTTALQDIFDAFANWLMAIYNGIINSEIDITLNDEMRQIYDAMLGTERVNELAPTSAFQNRIHEGGIVLGEPSTTSHITEEGYTYRSVGQSEIDAIITTQGVYSREGKQKGGNKNVKYWSRGNGKFFYNDTQNVIRVKNENIKEGEVVTADNLEIWNKSKNIFEPFNMVTPVSKEPIIEKVKGEVATTQNPFVNATPSQMSDGIRISGEPTTTELFEQVNEGIIEVIKVTETSNLYIVKDETDPIFSELGGSIEDAKETLLLNEIKVNETENTTDTTNTGQVETTSQVPQAEVIQPVAEPKIENVSFTKTLEATTPEPTPENLVSTAAETAFVQPIVTEEVKEQEIEVISNYNGFNIGDKAIINGKTYKIRSFSKLSGDYIVGASLMQGRFASPTTEMFSADALENIPQEVKAVEATRIVHIPVREIPEVDDFVEANDKSYIVKKVNLETNEAAVVKIVPGLEEADEIFVPLPSIQKIVKQTKTKVKVNSEKENKRQKLVTILKYMSEMFNNSIPFKIVDRPGETWAGSFKKGKVYVNLSMAETDTPIHEFLHPFIYVISKENPELYASLLKEMKTKITSKFITKEGDLYFIKNNDSIYGDERGYKTKKEAEEGVKEANSLIYEAYQKHKDLISKEDFYMNTPAAEQEEELLVRVLTERIASVLDEGGYVDRVKADELYNRSSNWMSTFVGRMLAYIDKFLGIIISTMKGIDRTNLLSKITSTEYNPKTGFFRLYKTGRSSKPLTVFIGKDGEKLKTGAIKVFLQDNFKKESEENINTFVQDIDLELNSIRDANNRIDTALDDRGYYVLNINVEEVYFNPLIGGSKVADGYNSYVDSKFLSSAPLTISSKNNNTFVSMPLSTTIDNLAAMITNRGLYAIDLSNHQEDFAKMSDRMAIKSPEDLTKFADTFRKKLLTLKNTLETRLKSGDLTEEVRSTVIRNLQQIKPLTDPEFLKNNDFVDIAVGTVKTGFESLMMAEQMMHKIRTKINYGDVNTYVEELEKRLLAAGIDIEYKPTNLFAIRLKKGKVILNKKLLIENGIVPFDIARNAVGDIDGQRNFINEVQQIHSKLIKEMEGTKLTQDEIKQLNWDIATLRNYYATFSGFTRTLLKEYMEHLDYSTEYMEFSNTLLEAGMRMKELEENMRTLATDWLFPYFDDMQNNALLQLTPEQRKEKYITKQRFSSLVRHAEADLSKLNYLFGTIVNTSDPINFSVSSIIADIINNNKDELGHLVSKSKFLKDSYFKSKGITTSQQRAQYIKDNFLRKVKVYETERDEYNNVITVNGEPKKSLVERWAIHTEYKEDEFELAREEYVKTLVKPVPPIERTPDAWTHYLEDRKDYREAIDKWSKDNKEKFRNQEYDKLIKNDEAFKFMVGTYEFANDKYGEIKLQYGIIPQAFLENAFIEKKKKQVSNIKDFIARFKDKNRPMHEKILGSAKAAANYLVNAQDELSYDRINPDGTEYRSIKTQYLRKLDEIELNFDLMDTLVGFSEDSFRYSSLREIQANVENLRLLINGYYKGAIDPRTVPKLNSNNQLIWDSVIGQTKAKGQIDNRLNKQLNGFIDDIFYGDTSKPSRINFYSSAKYKTNLARAKQMIGEGKTKDEIYTETTFYLDKDNQWKSDEYANVSVSLNKVAQNATFYTSALSLAFNIMSTARNLTIGNFTNFSEAYGGKYYSIPNYFKAQKIYGQAIPDNIKGFVMDEKNKLNQILFNYQAIQGEFRDRYNKLVTDSNILARLFSKDALFFLQHVAEHQIQGTATLAFMLSTNVKLKDGTTINLWDAHVLDEHGVIKLRDDVLDFDKTRFTRQLHEMNRSNHGNYSNLHKTVIQREWYGSLLMTFRKHMYPTLMARFGKKRMDYSKEAQVEGFHRLFWRKIAEDIMTYGMQIGKYESFSKSKRGEWAAEEKYGFNRSLMETMFGVLPLMILSLLLAGGDDDKEEDSVVKKWVAVLANGLYTDVAVTNPLGIYNPFVNQSEIYQEIKKITNNPVAVQYSYKKVADFLKELTKDIDDEEDRDVAGKFKKIIPIVKHTEFFTNPDEYISGYLKYQSLIGSGVK